MPLVSTLNMLLYITFVYDIDYCVGYDGWYGVGYDVDSCVWTYGW